MNRQNKKNSGQIVDMSGLSFGDWQVLCFSGTSINGKARWKCKCICGKIKILDGYMLRSGKSTRCVDLLEDMKKGLIRPADAKERANMYGKVIASAKVQLEQKVMQKDLTGVAFLKDE